MSVMLYCRVNCGFDSVVKILETINSCFGDVLGKVPCSITIENWVKKYGLDVYEHSGHALKGTDFAQIVDESMMIESEKLLVSLGIPANNQGRPLNFTDTQILDIAVAESWNGE